jgi:lysophospholipase L1-like esterase
LLSVIRRRPCATWRLLPLACLLALLPLASACEAFRKATEPTSDDNVVNYDAIGASDAIGYGSSEFCVPLMACPNGRGYVQQIARRLQATDKTVSLNNLGWPGAVLGPDIEALSRQLGMGADRNVIEDEAPYVRRDSTLVTVFIGANDANIVGRAVLNGLGGNDPGPYVQLQIQKFASNVQTLLSTIRGRSANARIVVLNLPNMANTPYAAGLTLAEKRILQTLTVGFSAGINALVSQGVHVVDLTCDPNFYNPGIFSSDGFHPNDAGYDYLTEVVYRAVTSNAPPPAASCPQMNVY